MIRSDKRSVSIASMAPATRFDHNSNDYTSHRITLTIGQKCF